MKHTQDEWKVILNDLGVTIETDFIAIAEVFTSTSKFEANAKLIAAAPDLLEALIEMVENNVDTHHSHITKAKAAIKKATE